MIRKLVIIALVLSNVHAFGQNAAKKPAKKIPALDYQAIGSPLPPVRLAIMHIDDPRVPVKKGLFGRKKKTPHDKIITNSDLDLDGNMLVMLFSPTCGHCEEKTEMLEKNIALFNKSKLVMVAASSMREYVPNFYMEEHISQYPTIILGVDSSQLINNLFEYKLLPQINIYNKDQKLIKKFYGEISIDSLKTYIQ